MGKRKPFVAICIPVYEKLELFKRLEESVLKQSYKNYMVIVTDNSMTKDIELYIKNSPLKTSKSFIYIHNDHNLGASGNTNKCISIGIRKGAELIKIMYQDDYFAFPNSLEKMVHTIEKEKTDALFTGDYEDFHGKKVERVTSREDIRKIREDLSFLFRANLLGAPSVMLFRPVSMKFDIKLQWLLDVDFYLRLLNGRRFSYIYEPLTGIGHDGNQLTDICMSRPEVVIKETLTVYRRYRWLHTRENHRHVVLQILGSSKAYVRNLFPN